MPRVIDLTDINNVGGDPDDKHDAISRIIEKAKKVDGRPLYILVWGGMGTLMNALYAAPEIAGKIRVLTIATNLMADNPDTRDVMYDAYRYKMLQLYKKQAD